jgi:hypothetical protein
MRTYITISCTTFSYRAINVLPCTSSKLTPWPSYMPYQFFTVAMIESVVSCGLITTRIGILALVFVVSSRSNSKVTFLGGVAADCFRVVGLTGFMTSIVFG